MSMSKCYIVQLKIDCNYCSVHEEITSIRVCTPCNPRGYFEKTEQIILINPYNLIQTFFDMILKHLFFFQNKANNRK